MGWRCFLLLIVLALCSGYGDDEVLLFRSDFSAGRDLTGWSDVHRWKPQNRGVSAPSSQWYRIVSEGASSRLQTEAVMFGLSSLLQPSLLIDDSVLEVSLTVTFRVPGGNNHPASLALTSRDCPSGRDGGPFWLGQRDSGFLVQGYQHSLQHANFIGWQKSGRRVIMSPPRPPFALLTQTASWVTWRCVYKHSEHALYFFREDGDTAPFLIQRQVDLSGVVLRSVWIGAWGAEYSDIWVSCRKKKQQQEK